MIDLHVIAVGDFGEAVAGELAERYQAEISVQAAGWQPSRWPRSRVQVVATWRETPALFDLADRMAFLLERPWLPVSLDATSLRVGPLVSGVAGSPCYQCFLTRQRQHARLTEIDLALHAAYDADPALGTFGHLATHVDLASAALGIAIDAVLDEPADGPPTTDRPGMASEVGRVRRIPLLSPYLTVDEVTPVHGCPRCSVPEPPHASWRELSDIRMRELAIALGGQP